MRTKLASQSYSPMGFTLLRWKKSIYECHPQETKIKAIAERNCKCSYISCLNSQDFNINED